MLGAKKVSHLACTLAAIAALATAAVGCGETSHTSAKTPAALTINSINRTRVAPMAAQRAAANFARAYARSADGRDPRAAGTPALIRQLRVNAQSVRRDSPLPPLRLVALSVTRSQPDAAAALATFRPGPGLPFRVGFTVELLGRRWRVTSVDGTGAGS